LEEQGFKDEIIEFIVNSPDETNIKIATFIAGMQAQKNIEEMYSKKQRADFDRFLFRSAVRNK
jgi:hypothetical protein